METSTLTVCDHAEPVLNKLGGPCLDKQAIHKVEQNGLDQDRPEHFQGSKAPNRKKIALKTLSSVITLKAANGYQFKTGQWKVPELRCCNVPVAAEAILI